MSTFFTRLTIFPILCTLSFCLNAQPVHKAGSPVYTPALLQEIRPAGWLRQQLEIMARGSSGHLDEIYDKLKTDNGWLGGEGDGWEETPYWLDGATPLAYLLGDERLREKVLKYINWTLDHQRASGYFGPVTPQERSGREITARDCSSGEDWWPKMIMLKILQQYYSATSDQRVAVFMTKYFRYQLAALPVCSLEKWSAWSSARGIENIMMVSWLKNITHDAFLNELEKTLQAQAFSWSVWFEQRTPLMQAAAQQNDKAVMERHGVNVAMGLKAPAEEYLVTGNKKYLDIQKTAFSDLMLLHGLPMGIFSADEDLHGNALQQGSELCAVTETMFSLEKIIGVTGDVQYMDALERLAFNALPAQTSDDYAMKQYFQLPNQVQIARGALAFTVTQDTGMSNVMGTKSGYTCCYANMHQGWTKFASQLWHHAGTAGIASLTYAPCTFHTMLKGVKLSIAEETDYPFGNSIHFRVSVAKEISFPWSFRIPSWCREAKIILNGQLLRSDKGGQIVEVKRRWKNNDELVLELPMQIKTSNWAANSRTVERGPLVYALKIKEEWIKGHHDIAGDYFSVMPLSPWNYGMLRQHVTDSSAFGFDQKPMPESFIWNADHSPVEITMKAKKIPSWTLQNGILYQPVSDRGGLFQGPTSDTIENITLIPYGCTKLRIVAFPVVK